VFSFDVGLGPFVTFVVRYGKVGSLAEILGTGLTGATTGPVTVTTPTGTLTSNVNFVVLP